MVDLQGTVLSDEEKLLLQHPLVGGVILFTRNYQSPEQLIELTQSIHAVRTPRLLIGVDHEGGRVQRFREGFTRIPAMRALGALYDKDKKQAKALAEKCGWMLASELLAVGIDFSFAPVLDIDFGVSSVIGDRSFHRKPDVIAELSHSLMNGMNEAGMVATGKHFPGHGFIEADSHIAMPVDDRPYVDIELDDLVPFERMINYGLAAVMPAHVIYPNVDPNPAGFSPFWINEVLRNRLHFQGVVFSDALDMEGATVAGSFTDRAIAALNAGCDMVLVCNSPGAAQEVVKGLEGYDSPASHIRLVRMHGKFTTDRVSLMRSERWKETGVQIQNFLESQEMELDL